MLARPKKVPNIRHSHFPSWCERKLLLLLILIASASSSSSSASSASSFCQTPMKKSMSCCQVSQANRGCSPPTFGSPGSRSYSPAPPGQLEFQYLGQLDRQINTSSLCENSIRCLIIQIYLPIYVYNIYIYICSPTDVSQYRWDQKRSASPMLGFSIPVLQHLFHGDVGDQQRQCLILATGCLPETPAAAASHWAVLLGRGDFTRQNRGEFTATCFIDIPHFSILVISKCT